MINFEAINPLIEIILKPYLDKIALLERTLEEHKANPHWPYRSSDLSLITEALACAQKEMKTAVYSKENRYYMQPFADLESVVMASRDSLTKNNLAVTQDIISQDDGSMLLITILLHTSNQFIESRIRLVPPKSDIQTIKSYINFWKREAYSSLIGVVSPFDDDDGEMAMASIRQETAKGTKLNTKYNPKENTYHTISKDQLEQLEYELSNYPDIAQQILDGLHLQALADMPKSKFQNAVDRVRKIKLLRTEGN